MNTPRLSLAVALSLAACGSSVDVAADAGTDQQPVTDVRELVDVGADVGTLTCARGFEFDRCAGPRACCYVDTRTTIPLGCGCVDPASGQCVRGACR